MRIPKNFKYWAILYAMGTASLAFYIWKYFGILQAFETHTVEFSRVGGLWMFILGAFIPIVNIFHLVDQGRILRHRSFRFKWILFVVLSTPILMFTAGMEIYVRTEMSRLGYIECEAHRSVGPRATVYHYYRDARLCY